MSQDDPVEPEDASQSDGGAGRRRALLEFIIYAIGIMVIVAVCFFAGMLLLSLILMVGLVLILRKSERPAKESTYYPEDERPVCPHCLAENLWWTTFCRECGAPLSGYAPIGPLERVYTLGWFWRKAIHGTPRLIGLIGMWVWFAPGILFSLPPMSVPPAVVAFAVGSNALSIALLARFTWHYIENPRPDRSQEEDDADADAAALPPVNTDAREHDEK